MSSPPPTQYRFAGFELRPHERTLFVDREQVPVTARAFDVLVALVERAGNLVTKEQLFDRVWPSLVVEENNLQVQVSTLRKIVGHDAIVTVPGHGYRFTLAVQTGGQDTARQFNVRAPPRPATKLVGRAADLREARSLLEHARLLSMVGVGGIGKTRLAIELAAVVEGQYPDGVAFVELAPVADMRSVGDVVASTLGVAHDPSLSTIDALLQHVASRRLLIVIDNCEHLLHACAELVARLLQSSAGLKVVVTTREALHIASEVIYQVPPLEVPGVRTGMSVDALCEFASVALFVDRASSVESRFAVTPDNAPYVVQICRELDGIPLALELAANRVRAMSVETIAKHLGDRLRLLVGGDRSALPRQQTLRALLDWSYQLLDDSERALLRRLAVFSGGFELDGAEAVGPAKDVREEDVLYLLANLVEKSLVEFEPRRNRYRLLETVRQYALEQLADAGEAGEARDRHIAFHVAMAERMRPIIRSSAQPTLVKRIESERDNIASAFAHARTAPGGSAAALTMVHPLLMALSSNNLELAWRLGHEALAHPDAQARNVARARALHVAGWNDFWKGRYEAALETVKESVSIAREIRDPKTLAEALKRLGYTATMLGHFDEARTHFMEALELSRALGDRYTMSSAHGGLGELYACEGRLDLAQAHYLEQLACNPDEQDGNAYAYANLARNAVALDNEADAVRYLRRAREAMGESSSAGFTQVTVSVCAAIATMRKEWERAVRLFAAEESHRQRNGLGWTEPDSSFYARQLHFARAAVGESAATEACAAGAALSGDAACAEAVAWLATLDAGAAN